jgi:putative toxin-antitoxin system antitoxin component (TIGR02293 family)
VYDHAVHVFGESERARHWLEQPKERYQGRTPLELLRTEAGGREVDNFLGQIDYGMFA